MIYFGRRYTCTVSGSVWKNVTCDACQCEYFYLLSRNATGSGASPYYLDNTGAQRRAQESAVKNLQRRLDRDHDAIGCPDCGFYTAPMVQLLRRKRWGWVHICGWVGIAAAFFVAWMMYLSEVRPGPQSFTKALMSIPALCLFGLGIGLIALSWVSRSMYDPNATASERAGLKQAPPQGPHRRAEFEALARAAAAREQNAAQLNASVNPSEPKILSGKQVAGRRVRCNTCGQEFVTAADDRCPLCRADWTKSPPRVVA